MKEINFKCPFKYVKLKHTLDYYANRKSMNILIFLQHVNYGMPDSECYYLDHP